MLNAFTTAPKGLIQIDTTATPNQIANAKWIDLFQPSDEQLAAVTALGITVPTLAEMEEIEISNRLYREDALDYMTVVVPGLTPEGTQMLGPVTFILSESHLITVHHHRVRPFETYPARAERFPSGCSSAERIFLGLIGEVVARQADLLEGIGRVLDMFSVGLLNGAPPARLQMALAEVGRQGETLGRIRLSLLTLERALSFYDQSLAGQSRDKDLRNIIKGQLRDIESLAVHGDFVSNRVSLAVDATLGMINLAQNSTVRIVSVVAVLFLPPTLIASVYGMNFAHMPELNEAWGYPVALGVMVLSAVGTWAFFKWKNWL